MQLYLTPIAIGYLTQLILATLISGYFVLLLHRDPRVLHLVWLARMFVALMGFIGTLFLEAAFLPTPRLYAVFLQNTLLGVMLTCLLQFSYHFPVQVSGRRWEARVVLVLSSLYTLWEAGYAVFRFFQLRDGHILYRPTWSDYALLLLLLWVPASFFRHLCALDPVDCPWKVWLQLWRRPEGRETRAVRGFILIFLFVASLSVFNILRSHYLLSVALANQAISTGILVALVSFAITYLNYRAETTSFMLKLVGVTLTVVLAIMGIMGEIVSSAYIAHYYPPLRDQRTLRFTPNDRGGYDITEVPFIFVPVTGRKLNLAEDAARTCSPPQPFTFPFYGQVYSRVYVCNDGAVSLGSSMTYRMYQYRYGAGMPLIFPLLTDLHPQISPGGVFVQTAPECLVVTWERLRGFVQQDLEFTFQLILYANGMFEVTYNGLPDSLAFDPNDDPGASVWAVGAIPGYHATRAEPKLVSLTELPLSGGPEGILESYYLDFRQYLHTLFLPLAELILVTSALIIGGFPLLFYVALVNPLNTLLEGVQRIEDGDYTVTVPVQYADEIGYLTGAFNILSAKLGDLIGTLEARVAARTSELDAANVHLRSEIIERERAQGALIEQQRALAALEERDQLARDLHDGLAQVMGYINVQAQAAQAYLAQGQVQVTQNNLTDMVEAVRQAHRDIRAYILDMRASPAPRQDFFTAVQDYIEQFERQSEIVTTLNLPDSYPKVPFPPIVEKQALHFLQESLTNIRKHAQAREVEVLFSFTDDYVHIVVSDDGCGFDVRQQMASANSESASLDLDRQPSDSKTQAEKHLGLGIMQDRVTDAGGTLEVRSTPGQGTRILAILPRLLPTGRNGEVEEIKSIRVLLADDHPLFLDGLRNLLIARGLTVVGVARDGFEVQNKVRALRPDVVVMDLNMPKCDGFEATRAIKAEFPDTKIVVLTAFEDEEYLFEALRSGASGYLLKTQDANDFCTMLTRVVQDEVPLAPGMAKRVLAEFASMASPPTVPAAEEAESPSPQQWEILGMVAEGKIYREIALEMHLTEKTIKYHMRRILDLLHLETRAQAIAYYQQIQEDEEEIP